MQPKFDAAKPVQTRDGRKVRIVATRSGDFPIVALLTESNGEEVVQVYTADGGYWLNARTGSVNDLVNVPTERVFYVNVYPNDGHVIHPTVESADEDASSQRVARVRVVVKDGQFDE